MTKFVQGQISKRLAFLEITRLKEERNYRDTGEENKSKKETFNGDLKGLQRTIDDEDDDQLFNIDTKGNSSF